MTDSSTKDLAVELNKIAADDYPPDMKKIMIGILNMGEICTGLMAKLFQLASQRKYAPWFQFVTEARHTDFARNTLGQKFMESPCEMLFMLDDDVDPHKDILDFVELNKDIVSANVYCYIRGDLMPSIWQLAECEQCREVEHFKRTGKVNDITQYIQEPEGTLQRWNPFRNTFQPFFKKRGNGGDHIMKCRCKGTGWDPWVYRTHQKIVGHATLMKVDSVGSAAMLIHRRVFEKISFPWFRFLYKPSGEILLTEDHFFCWKAREEGFEVWADPQMFCSHFKQVDLWACNTLFIKAYQRGIKYAEDKISSQNRIVIPTSDLIINQKK